MFILKNINADTSINLLKLLTSFDHTLNVYQENNDNVICVK